MKAILRFLLSAVCVIITAYLLPGIEVKDMLAAVVVAAILALLNMIVKPILVILTIPVTIFTLGLFLLIINGFLVWLTGEIVPDYFYVKSIWWAIIFSVILSIVNSILERILGLKKEKKK